MKSNFKFWHRRLVYGGVIALLLVLVTAIAFADDLGGSFSECVDGNCPSGVFPEPSANCTGTLTDASYSVFVGGDMTVGQEAAEGEGKVAVGGDMTFDKPSDDYTIGRAGGGSCVAADGTALLVRGDMHRGANAPSGSGFLVNSVYHIGGSDNDAVLRSGGGSTNMGAAAINAELDFESVLNTMQGRSQCWSAAPATGSKSYTTFTGDADNSGNGSMLQVFNIDEDVYGDIYFRRIPDGATVLVNIAGANRIWAPNTTYWSNTFYGSDYIAGNREHLLLNFYEATSVSLGGKDSSGTNHTGSVDGSVLVPRTDSTVTVKVVHNGRLMVGGDLVHQGDGSDGGTGTELHNYPFTGELPDCDWGDHPDAPYSTVTDIAAAAQAPSHILTDGLYLGSCVDAETNGQPTANAAAASEDDANGSNSNPASTLGTCATAGDDEDGVTYTNGDWSEGTDGGEIDVVVNTNNASGACFNGWIDWSMDGDFDDDNEQIFTNELLASGSHTLNFDIPSGVLSGSAASNAYHLRFRLTDDCTTTPVDSTNPQPTGEVEDYIYQHQAPQADYDWGDLPDSFGTTNSAGGPNHVIGSDLYLGSCVDAETDGQVDSSGHAGASSGGDDNTTGSPVQGTCTNNDDEDGVTLTTPLIPGNQACFSVSAHNATSNDVNIYAWVDWNGDGDFSDGSGGVDNDEAFTLGTVPASTNWTDHELCTTVPSAATFDGGEVHMRFRFTTDNLGGTDWGGSAADGEIEDYWYPLACVGNYVWNDENGSDDDTQDTGGDVGIGSVGMRLVWAGANGVIATDASHGSAQDNDDVLYTTDTAADGSYSFCGLIPGTYRIEIPNPPSDLQVVAPNSGSDNNIDSDGEASSGVGSPVDGDDFTITDVTALPTGENGTLDNTGAPTGAPNNFPDGQVDETHDFGFMEPKVAIGNRVWADTNTENSLFDNGNESGIDEVTVGLYRDDGDGECEPGGDDSQVATTDTDNGGYYQFLRLEASTAGQANTCYCVAIAKSEVSSYSYNSSGWTSDPDSTDEFSGQGDDGYPSGSYVVSKPVCATLNGQTQSDEGDPNGYNDESAYMTVDFGFHNTESNAVSLKSVDSTNSNAILWGVVMLSLGAIALASFFWRRRSIL